MSLEADIGAKIDEALLKLQDAGSASCGTNQSDIIKILQTCKKELDQTKNTIKLVRKVNLLNLIRSEMEEYDRELRTMGKCFSPAIRI